MIKDKVQEIQAMLEESPWIRRYSNNMCLITGEKYKNYHHCYFDECFKHVTVNGMWMEFGVYRGRTLSYISDNTNNTVYGFDSFEGLPEDWNYENPKGVFNLGGEIPIGAIDGENSEDPGMYTIVPAKKTKPWNSNVKFVKGYFNDSLPSFLLENEGPVAFLHVDSDLYSSANTILTLLQDRIVDGTIICFDDLMDFNINRNNEILAFAEFLLRTGVVCEPIAYQTFENCIYRQGCFKIKR